jgi:hypothetical protein
MIAHRRIRLEAKTYSKKIKNIFSQINQSFRHIRTSKMNEQVNDNFKIFEEVNGVDFKTLMS